MEKPLEIKKLDQDVINRIAAGEVIQRPANALKEMIENSLDAKSTNIQITVKNGGLKHIQIQDNGVGIRREDFEIVCERFTTSKLREFEDLQTISTYGFRGEALASISHVAYLSIQSKTEDSLCAYKASFVDGKMVGETPKPVAGNRGTQITVEDLFYNMNIRKRALKSASEEYHKISDVVGKYAIHNSKVGFALKKFGEQNDIRTPTDSNYVDNIRTIYGNLIARELIEFNLENEPFQFSVHGFMTNVNYSTKSFNFVLFINDRLVSCQSLKKCVDQVYSTYLPKNAHPFVYLSLKINPANVDVNVHPTKHEVHFLNEEQIVEIVTGAIENKLLGSNNSRMFYMQAKLPVVPKVETPTTSKDAKTTPVQDKNLVRTDWAEQKLDKFFTAECEKGEISKSKNKKPSIVATFSTSLMTSRPEAKKCELTSVLLLRKEIENECHVPLRELFAQHVFVGCIDAERALVQHGTKLYLCNTRKIVEELFYQMILYNFQAFVPIRLADPVCLHQLVRIALDLPETGWTEEDGNKEELAQRATELITERGEMLATYFSTDIDQFGKLNSLPLVISKHVPELAGLPLYMLRLATEVNWDDEKECFQSYARETARFYAQLRQENTVESANWKWTVEHLFYPALKKYFLPPKCFAENAAILQIADLPKLYKVFERC